MAPHLQVLIVSRFFSISWLFGFPPKWFLFLVFHVSSQIFIGLHWGIRVVVDFRLQFIMVLIISSRQCTSSCKKKKGLLFNLITFHFQGSPSPWIHNMWVFTWALSLLHYCLRYMICCWVYIRNDYDDWSIDPIQSDPATRPDSLAALALDFTYNVDLFVVHWIEMHTNIEGERRRGGIIGGCMWYSLQRNS